MSSVSSPLPPLDLDQLLRHRGDLLTTQLDTEIVAMDVDSGAYFGFNPVASQIWTMLAQPMTLRALCEQLCARYNVAPDVCEKDVRALLDQMRRENVLELVKTP